MKKVAFLGLGMMGAPMARNLIKAGFEVTVYNRTEDKTKPFQDLGAKVAKTPAEAVADVEVIISIVSDPDAVREVLLGEQGVTHGAKSGSLMIEMSTIDPQTAIDCAEKFEEKGIGFLDAPVTGSVKGATEGTLTIMVGGKKAALGRAQEVLAVLAGSVHHMGEVGFGQKTKLVLNSLIAATVYSYAEVIILAEAQGLAREQIINFLNQTGATSEGMRAKSQNFLKRDYPAAFYAKLMTKDIRLALGEAQKYNVAMPQLAIVNEIFTIALKMGLGEEDTSAVIKALEKINGGQ